MSDSEGFSSEREGSPLLRNRSTKNSSGRLNSSSPKEKKSSPEKQFTPRYAVTTIEIYTPATKDQILLEKGDVIVDLKQLFSSKFKIWEGENKRTGQRGFFHEENVEFHTGSPPDLPNVLNDSQQPGIPTAIGSDVPQSHPTQSQNGAEESRQSNNPTLFILVLAVVAVGILLSVVGLDKFLWSRSRNPVNLTELEGAFKSQDPFMWDTLRAGLLPSKTELVKTFLFVHAKDGPTTECLIKQLSDNYCTVYRAGDMNFDDDFVSKVKRSLQNRKCMVIYDLENLTAEGITVLKGFCDAYTPIVPKAEFYFALDTGEPPVSENVNKVAREKLETMWSEKYSHDEFGGTLTRLTQNVLRVIGEDKLPC